MFGPCTNINHSQDLFFAFDELQHTLTGNSNMGEKFFKKLQGFWNISIKLVFYCRPNFIYLSVF